MEAFVVLAVVVIASAVGALVTISLRKAAVDLLGCLTYSIAFSSALLGCIYLFLELGFSPTLTAWLTVVVIVGGTLGGAVLWGLAARRKGA